MRNIFFLFIAISFVACESNQDYKMRYSGVANEIIIVSSAKEWNGKIGTSLQKYFADYETVLPQPERKFWIINIDEENFDDLFQTHRNVLLINLKKRKNPIIEFKENLWSKGQLLCEITAETEQECVQLIEKHGKKLVYRFHQAEIERQIAKNEKFGDKTIAKQLLAKHKLKITAQQGAYIATDSSNFVWVRLEREKALGGFEHQISQGILIYYYPYKDTSQLNPVRLLAIKDSITKNHLPGSSEKSYMTVSSRGELPESEPINFKGSYAMQIKGLWRMENNFMGGPFISISTIDTINHRVVTAEGYVFAPQFKKRDYLYEVEAMLKSLTFTK